MTVASFWSITCYVRVARQVGRVTSRIDGVRLAASAIGVVGSAVALWMVGLFTGFETGALLESPEFVVGAFAVVGIVTWVAAPQVLRAGWPRAIAAGIATGIATDVALVVSIIVAGITDSLLRSGSALDTFGTAIPWAIYGLALSILYFSIFTIPVGLIWAVSVRLSLRGRWIGMGEAGRSRAAVSAAFIGIVVVGMLAGAIQTFRAWQPDAMCPTLDGAPAIDASFSPDGSQIAVITSQDPNAQGTVWLIDLDAGRTLARWTTWVDQDVVTDGRGRVWWSAFEAESPYRSAIMTARVGGEPTWFSDASSELLWDLQWTDGALVGMTSNSHIPAHLDLDGIGPPTLMAFGRHGAVGSLWVSADRSTMVTSEEWGGQVLSVESKDRALPRRIPYRGDPRSITITPDERELVIADWSGGTRAVDIRTGRSRVLLTRTQRFAAVSSRGDLAWADDETIGPGRLCIAHRFAAET